MQTIEFLYKDSCLVPAQELERIGKQVKEEIKRVEQSLTTLYDSNYASIHVVTDEHMLDVVQAVVAEKKAIAPTMLIVIGIGGSNLGAMAVHEALHGRFYNETNPNIKVYWADTVDGDYIHAIATIMEKTLQQNQQVIINVISKSGTTTETIANFLLFLEILKKYRSDDYHRYVVATTDKNSKLWHVAEQEQCVVLEIPKNVGGRYSVLSPVGLFPLAMLGVDIQELVQGARAVMPEYIDENIVDNSAALSAIILAYHYRAGKNIHDTFLFSNELESLGKWYRQLMGESIGKEYNTKGERVMVGMTPTVSLGSVDLHSVGQLYLGGPHDKMTTFVTVKRPHIDTNIPAMRGYDALVENIQDKSLDVIMHAIVHGVQRAYKKLSLPYVSFVLPEKSAFFIGQFLQCKMLEIMYLGYVLEVNPFDQPHVELYKHETRDILKP